MSYFRALILLLDRTGGKGGGGGGAPARLDFSQPANSMLIAALRSF